MTADIFDETACTLGEGVFWHSGRGALFWFDILAGRLYERGETGLTFWDFGEPASAAACTQSGSLLVATASGLKTFDPQTGSSQPVATFPQSATPTRSNDGRADRQGGFWIGTMGLGAEPGAGALYRFFKGELRPLVFEMTIPNGIAFTPDGTAAYYTDTTTRLVWRQPLDAEGWPTGERKVFLDLRAEALNPDGAVVDAAGNYWSAQWGAHRVACYSPEGDLIDTIAFPAAQTSCPAFGGARLDRLFVTTAREGLSDEALAQDPLAGQTFVAQTTFKGLPEPAILLE